MDISRIGRFIAELRQSKGMTQKELAAQLRISDKTISRWETGKGLPDPSSWQELSALLGVSINELMAAKSLDSAQKLSDADRTLLETTQFFKSSERRNSRTRLVIILSLTTLLLIGGVLILQQLGVSNDILITSFFTLLNLALLILIISGIVLLVVFLSKLVRRVKR